MPTNNYSSELYHHGVLGMKWGVRKSDHGNGRSSSRRKTKKVKLSEDAKTANALKKKKVGEMSNAELRKLTERQQLEQNYSRLNPSAVKKGLSVAAGVAAGLGTVTALYTNADKVVSIGKKVAQDYRYRQMKIPGF